MDAGGASTAVHAAEAVESLASKSRSSSGITSAGGVAEYTERRQRRRMQQAIDRAAKETGRTCGAGKALGVKMDVMAAPRIVPKRWSRG